MAHGRARAAGARAVGPLLRAPGGKVARPAVQAAAAIPAATVEGRAVAESRAVAALAEWPIRWK